MESVFGPLLKLTYVGEAKQGKESVLSNDVPELIQIMYLQNPFYCYNIRNAVNFLQLVQKKITFVRDC